MEEAEVSATVDLSPLCPPGRVPGPSGKHSGSGWKTRGNRIVLYIHIRDLFMCGSLWRLYPSVRRAIWQRGQFQCHGNPESAGAKLNPSCTCIGMKTPPEFGCGHGRWTLDAGQVYLLGYRVRRAASPQLHEWLWHCRPTTSGSHPPDNVLLAMALSSPEPSHCHSHSQAANRQCGVG